MSDGVGGWKSEEQKSLRELSTTLASFQESQAQIKCIFSLYDHDSDGICTTNQTIMLMRKLGYDVPSSWAYVYRDAITLPMVRSTRVF
jgi:Ca2+-binding EF-hand superfamily protein